MASRFFWNTHSLYLSTGALRQEQVEAAVAASMAQIRKAYSTDPELSKATWEVNVVTDTKGTLFGITYLFMGSPKAYYILAGFNPDGSPRVEEFPDPEWKAPVVPRTEISTVGMSWGEASELEEEEEKKYTAPIIKRQLPPIAVLPAVAYTRDQVLAVARKLRADAIGPFTEIAGANIDTDPETPGLDPEVRDAIIQIQSMRTLFSAEEAGLNAELELTEKPAPTGERLTELKASAAEYKRLQAEYPDILTPVPRHGFIKVQQSYAQPPSTDTADPTTLACRTAPLWITEDLMHTYFDKFNSDPSFHEVTVSGRKERIKFPRIRVCDNVGKTDFEGKAQKMVYVTFSPKADCVADAAFALQMRRKFTVRAPDGKTAQLIFSHWLTSKEGGRYNGSCPGGRGGGRGGGGRGSSYPPRPATAGRGRGLQISASPSVGRLPGPPKPPGLPPPSSAPRPSGLPVPGAAPRPTGTPALPPQGAAWRSSAKK